MEIERVQPGTVNQDRSASRSSLTLQLGMGGLRPSQMGSIIGAPSQEQAIMEYSLSLDRSFRPFGVAPRAGEASGPFLPERMSGRCGVPDRPAGGSP